MSPAPDEPAVSVTTRPRRRHRRVWRWAFLLVGLTLIVCGGYSAWRYHGPTSPVEIYPGIIYSCERLPDTSESSGLLHIVRADLNTPGVELYVTPLDADAVAHGWEYRLKYVSSVVRDQHLAAAVNGTLFDSDSGLVRFSGEWAKALETAVSDRAVNHIDPNTYLLWWDDERIAHLEMTKPPSQAVLAKARWAIGGQQPMPLSGGKGSWSFGTKVDKRTMIGVDPQRRLVWLAVFDRASYDFGAGKLADLGAKFCISVDGGTSSAMAIGDDAKGVRPGTVTGNWRPVATVFGFRVR